MLYTKFSSTFQLLNFLYYFLAETNEQLKTWCLTYAMYCIEDISYFNYESVYILLIIFHIWRAPTVVIPLQLSETYITSKLLNRICISLLKICLVDLIAIYAIKSIACTMIYYSMLNKKACNL